MIEYEPQKRPFTLCPKCGRFIRIDGHCECEVIFLTQYIYKSEKIKSLRLGM